MLKLAVVERNTDGWKLMSLDDIPDYIKDKFFYKARTFYRIQVDFSFVGTIQHEKDFLKLVDEREAYFIEDANDLSYELESDGWLRILRTEALSGIVLHISDLNDLYTLSECVTWITNMQYNLHDPDNEVMLAAVIDRTFVNKR